MPERDDILALWRAHAEAAPVTKHPTVWVAHFGTTDQMLADRLAHGPMERRADLMGTLSSTDPNSIGNAILFLAAPWITVSEIHELAVVVDVNRTLHLTHMVDYGARQKSTDWHVPYGMTDDGRIEFYYPERARSDYWSDLDLVWQARSHDLGAQTFHDAYLKALYVGELLL